MHYDPNMHLSYADTAAALRALIEQAFRDEASRIQRAEERNIALAAALEATADQPDLREREADLRAVEYNIRNGVPPTMASHERPSAARAESLPPYDALVSHHYSPQQERLFPAPEFKSNHRGQAWFLDMGKDGQTHAIGYDVTNNNTTKQHRHSEILEFSPPRSKKLPRNTGPTDSKVFASTKNTPTTRKITVAEANRASQRSTSSVKGKREEQLLSGDGANAVHAHLPHGAIPVHTLTIGHRSAAQQQPLSSVASLTSSRVPPPKRSMMVVDIKSDVQTPYVQEWSKPQPRSVEVDLDGMSRGRSRSDGVALSSPRSPSYPSHSPSEIIEMRVRDEFQRKYQIMPTESRISSIPNHAAFKLKVFNDEVPSAAVVGHVEKSRSGPNALNPTTYFDAHYGIFGDEGQHTSTKPPPKKEQAAQKHTTAIKGWLQDQSERVHPALGRSSEKAQKSSHYVVQPKSAQTTTSSGINRFATPIKIAERRQEIGVMSPRAPV